MAPCKRIMVMTRSCDDWYPILDPQSRRPAKTASVVSPHYEHGSVAMHANACEHFRRQAANCRSDAIPKVKSDCAGHERQRI